MHNRFEEIERIGSRDARIAGYRDYLRAYTNNERAWNNLAVDLLAAGRFVEARELR